MPAICNEVPVSRDGSKAYAGAGLVREFVVLHEPDLLAAIALVENTAEISYLGFERKEISWKSLGFDLWLFTCRYASAASAGSLRPDNFAVKITAASVNIKQSKQTLFRLKASDVIFAGSDLEVDAANNKLVFPPAGPLPGDEGKSLVITGGAGWTTGTYLITDVVGVKWLLDRSPAAAGTAGGVYHIGGSAPDFKGAIQVARDDVLGCEVIAPELEVVYSSRRSNLNDAYLRTARELVGKTNATEFRGYPAGSLLYLGFEPTSPEGTLQSGLPFAWWNLAHAFKVGQNRTNVKIGDITVPSIGAWDFV
jgi:hypothetical protein